MRKYDICTKKVYEINGQEKKSWPRVGSLVYFPANGDKPEGYKLELNMYPGTPFFIFEQKPKDGKNPNGTMKPEAVDNAAVDAAGDVAPEDLPF